VSKTESEAQQYHNMKDTPTLQIECKVYGP